MSMPPETVTPAGRPQPQPLRPVFVADKVRFGVTGDGTTPAMAFGFSDEEGNQLPPVILTNATGGINAEMLEEFQRVVNQVAPPAEVEIPVVHCQGCGTRIFGPLIDTGYCLVCKPS